MTHLKLIESDKSKSDKNSSQVAEEGIKVPIDPEHIAVNYWNMFKLRVFRCRILDEAEKKRLLGDYIDRHGELWEPDSLKAILVNENIKPHLYSLEQDNLSLSSEVKNNPSLIFDEDKRRVDPESATRLMVELKTALRENLPDLFREVLGGLPKEIRSGSEAILFKQLDPDSELPD